MTTTYGAYGDPMSCMIFAMWKNPMKAMRTVIAIWLGSLCAAAAVRAHDHHDHSQATGVVKERMDAMSEMGKRVKAIKNRVQTGDRLARVSEDAVFIRDAAAKIVPLFPAGSKNPPTEAASAIWLNFEDFEVKASALEREAAKLASMPVGDAVAMARQATAVGEACLSCHEKYRIKQ